MEVYVIKYKDELRDGVFFDKSRAEGHLRTIIKNDKHVNVVRKEIPEIGSVRHPEDYSIVKASVVEIKEHTPKFLNERQDTLTVVTDLYKVSGFLREDEFLTIDRHPTPSDMGC